MAIQLPILSTFDNRGVKKANSALGGLTKAVVGFGIAAAGAFAIRGVANFTKEAVSSASDLAESLNAVTVSFGDASDAVIKLGEDSASRLGVAQSAFNNAAVRFSAFADQVVGDGGDVGEFIDDVTTRATDFASVFNIDVSEALQVFQSGLAGEAEPLKRFGINLLQAEVEAFALRDGIISVGETMTEQEKVQARYGLLMESTAQTAGDFANTSDGLANQQRILSAEFEQIRSEIGTALIPIFEELNGYILDNVIPTLKTFAEEDFPALIDNMRDRAAEIKPIFEEIEERLRQSFDIDADVGILEAFFDSLSELFANPAFADLLVDLVEGFVELLPSLAELLPLLVEFYQVAIPALIQILPAFTNLLRGIVGLFGNEPGGMAYEIPKAIDKLFDLDFNLRLFPDAADKVREVADNMPNWFATMTEVFDTAKTNWPEAIAGTFANIGEVFTNSFLSLFGITDRGMNEQTERVGQSGPVLFSTANGVLMQMLQGFLGAWPAIAEWFGSIPTRIKNFFTNLPGDMANIGRNIFDGLWNGLKNIWPRISRWVRDKVNDIKNRFEDALDIASPSGVFEGYGENIVEGLLNGLNSNQPALNATVDGLVSAPDMGAAPTRFGGGGPTYQINVQAGVGDPVRIGEEVVTAIKRYERVSGPVFASA